MKAQHQRTTLEIAQDVELHVINAAAVSHLINIASEMATDAIGCPTEGKDRSIWALMQGARAVLNEVLKDIDETGDELVRRARDAVKA